MASKTKIINILPVVTTVTIEKQSPMLNLIGIKEVYVDYDTNESKIFNIKVFLKKIQSLRENNTNFDNEVQSLANKLNVDINSYLLFYVFDNSDSKKLLKSYKKSLADIKLSPKVNIDHEVDIKGKDNYREKIIVHEINQFDEVIGVANITFSKKIIDLKEISLL